MTILSSAAAILTGWRGYLAAAATGAVLAGLAAHSVTAMAWRADYEAQRAEYATGQAVAANAALDQFAADVSRIHGAAVALGEWQVGFDSSMSTISKDLRDAIAARPLPPDCRPDAGRLRSLDAAVAAANAARSAGP